MWQRLERPIRFCRMDFVRQRPIRRIIIGFLRGGLEGDGVLESDVSLHEDAGSPYSRRVKRRHYHHHYKYALNKIAI